MSQVHFMLNDGIIEIFLTVMFSVALLAGVLEALFFYVRMAILEAWAHHPLRESRAKRIRAAIGQGVYTIFWICFWFLSTSILVLLFYL